MRGYIGLLLLGTLILTGCTSLPRGPDRDTHGQALPSTGQLVAASALAVLGKPYRYGGHGPDGFDCSGLVRFAFAAAGIQVPRTTAEQFRAAAPVDAEDLRIGDLLFFRIGGSGVSHVGIYTGERRFIHAPQTGRPVETRSMDDEYYRARLLRVGRLY